MKNYDLIQEAASLGGYTANNDTNFAANKARAQRRVNLVKSYLTSKYGGRWPSLYRDGWLPLVPLYTTGTCTFTNDSRTVAGASTAFTSAMVGRKILGPSSEYYKIASVTNGTTLILTEPYQGTTGDASTFIWKDEYVLYPDVYSVIDFINYADPQQMVRSNVTRVRGDFPREVANEYPRKFSVLGRKDLSTAYSTGTVSGTINTTTLTGSGTAWLTNVEPGFDITVGAYTYRVKNVLSDTSLELYQMLYATISAGTSYSSVGKNALIVRFVSPSEQRIVNYSYYRKDFPFVNDSDEDWVAEMYPNILVQGMVSKDFLDKNDPVRSQMTQVLFDDLIRDAFLSETTVEGAENTLEMKIPDGVRE